MSGLNESDAAERFVNHNQEDVFVFSCPYCLDTKNIVIFSILDLMVNTCSYVEIRLVKAHRE
eukprot:TRINITY_DN12524_c0_g1_i1.p2 TRINITY_DN12524_c0_g1~~TRINITY_DN12524_c0_g1_i1.p2  ORF type:complete len:62 (+),score=17.78 TRINITY_DN12524_c0_g1_i1:183-368(+)